MTVTVTTTMTLHQHQLSSLNPSPKRTLIHLNERPETVNVSCVNSSDDRPCIPRMGMGVAIVPLVETVTETVTEIETEIGTGTGKEKETEIANPGGEMLVQIVWLVVVVD